MPSTAIHRLRTLAVAPLILLCATALAAQRAPVCGDVEKRAALRRLVQRHLVANGPEAIYSRNALHIPRVHPDSVVYIDDEPICERAARAYYRHRLGPRPLGGVSVVRVGDMYVVLGENRGGEWTSLTTFTRDFERVGSIGV